MPTLTKSKYITGLQCLKLLWVTFNDPGRIPPVDPGTQLTFDQGHEVGDLAKKLYPAGVDIPYNDFKESIAQTKELLSQRKPLFEASILAGNLYCRLDILNPVNGDAWNIIEVKSSTQVKDVNISDVSFQKYCCEQSGLTINKCYLVHIDTSYVRKGEIDPQEYFAVEDVSRQVKRAIVDVPASIDRILKGIALKKCPDVNIGFHCSDPYQCSLKEQCWAFLPDNSVFNLYRLGSQKKFDFFQQGIKSIEDIPDDYELSDKQIIQKVCIQNKSVHTNKDGIKDFLETLKYPLYYLDFETFSPAIPLYDGMRPYQRVPFQFSLHIVRSEGAQSEHYSFLAEGKDDSRPAFLSVLQENIGTEGNVIVYNASFENGVLNELIEAFPENTGWINNVLGRVKDLLDPFRSFHYYNPEQNGSASLKCVLPSVTGKGYEDMNISNGGDASRIFFQMHLNPIPENEAIKVQKDLEDYCCLDTQAMVDIVEQLSEIVNGE